MPLPSACYMIEGAKSHLGDFHLITLPFLEYRWKLSQNLKKASRLFIEDSNSLLIFSNCPFREWCSSAHKSINVSARVILSSSKAYLHLRFHMNQAVILLMILHCSSSWMVAKWAELMYGMEKGWAPANAIAREPLGDS